MVARMEGARSSELLSWQKSMGERNIRSDSNEFDNGITMNTNAPSIYGVFALESVEYNKQQLYVGYEETRNR